MANPEILEQIKVVCVPGRIDTSVLISPETRDDHLKTSTVPSVCKGCAAWKEGEVPRGESLEQQLVGPIAVSCSVELGKFLLFNRRRTKFSR